MNVTNAIFAHPSNGMRRDLQFHLEKWIQIDLAVGPLSIYSFGPELDVGIVEVDQILSRLAQIFSIYPITR